MLSQLLILIAILYSVSASTMDVNIIGGVQVPKSNHDFEFMTSLQDIRGGKTYHFCGGALIDPYWIITAAHCVVSGKPGRVRIGSHNTDYGGITRQVSKVVNYPKYSKVTKNDISLLKLSEPVYEIEPIKIDFDNMYNNPKDTVTSIGWGYTKQYSGKVVKDLRMVNLEVLDNKVCSKHYPAQINDGNICTWGRWNPKTKQRNDQCSGDSGGPTFYYNKQTGETALISLTSWGRGCGQKHYPGVNTRVSHFYNFINKHINNNVPTAKPTTKPTQDLDLQQCYNKCRKDYRKGRRRRRCKAMCRH